MWEMWRLGGYACLGALTLFAGGCSNSDDNASKGGSAGTGTTGGAATTAGSGGTSSGGNTAGSGGSGGLLGAGYRCDAPATKCKGHCITAAAQADDCSLLAEGTFGDLQLEGDTLYLRDYADVVKIPKAGGMPATVLTNNTAAFFRVDGDYVYFGWEFAPINLKPAPKGGYVARAPLAGGAAEYLVDELHSVRDLRIVGSTLYMADCANGAGGLFSTGPLGQISIDNQATPLVTSVDAVCSFEIDGQFAYAGIETADHLGQLVKVPLAGGDPQVLYQGEADESFNVFANGGYLYWVSYSNALHFAAPPGKLGRIELATGTNAVLADTDGYSTKLSADASYAYIASDTLMWRVPVTGGAPERVLTMDDEQLGPYLLDGDSFILALAGTNQHFGGLLRTSTKPELLPKP